MADERRRLPSITELLERPAVRALAERVGRPVALQAARDAVAAARENVRAGEAGQVSDEAVEQMARKLLQPKLRRVINATGVVLHTNLGRAPLHPEVAAQVAQVASGYSNLELDLDSGKRGARHAAVEPLLRELFGAEAAHVTTNCAGATLLALSAVGAGGAAVVSRGELVEIGGGFRVPEILEQSGCKLHEVGTTNRTHLRDYEAALDELARAGSSPIVILRVHRSNFALVGFQTQPGMAELANLAHARGVPLLHDLGSGAAQNPVVAGLPAEMTAAESLRAGADLVLASGDKLLGGPQAGLILGKKALVEKCRKHPLARALRADKMLLAALEGTLSLYAQGRAAELPAIAALGASGESLRQKATRLALALGEKGAAVRVVDCEGRVGGGSLPLARLPSWGVSLDCDQPRALLAALRGGKSPAMGLLRDGAVVLDVRCVLEGELAALAETAASALSEVRSGSPASRGDDQAIDATSAESATLEE